MPKNAELKQTQKSVTLICQVRNKNKRYSHRTRTQLTRKTVPNKKREKQRKKCVKKHTMRARNTEANLANVANTPKCKNKLAVTNFLK